MYSQLKDRVISLEIGGYNAGNHNTMMEEDSWLTALPDSDKNY